MNREPMDDKNTNTEYGMDELLRETFKADAPSPEAEAKMRGRLAEFRERLDGRDEARAAAAGARAASKGGADGEEGAQRPWWAVLAAPRTLARLAIAGGAACAVIAAVVALQTPRMATREAQSKVRRVQSDSRAIATGLEAYNINFTIPTDGSLAYTYNPTNGTVSAGDVWRVKGDSPTPQQMRSNEKPSWYAQPSTNAPRTERYSYFVTVADGDADLYGDTRVRAKSYFGLPQSSIQGSLGPEQQGAQYLSWDWQDNVSSLKKVPESSTEQDNFMGGEGQKQDKALPPEPPSDLSAFDRIVENPFLSSIENPLSTFSIDVDTASYSNMRRMLMAGQLPPADAVRIEEMLNYFAYDYPLPSGDEPFSVTTEIATCPWAPGHRLARIGLRGYEIPADQRPASNLVFLIDVSGSMNSQEKLPLLKEGFKAFVHQLTGNDRVAIVVYAGASGLVLPSTPATDRQTILDALDRLQSGGSTNGGAGIQLAYDVAAQNFIRDGVNRVILATDGDFNVGITDRAELVRLIEEKAKTGVFLSVLGYGIAGTKDSVMEELSNKGNGNYAYIDDELESRRVLIDQMSATLVTIAKDVKIQVEFNPAEVAAYRLIGYENRMLRKEDFNDDTKDAGEIGAGHTVTALYELIPAGGNQASGATTRSDSSDLSDMSHQPDRPNQSDPTDRTDGTGKPGAAESAPASAAIPTPFVDALKYQAPVQLSEAARTGECFTLKLRYKKPDGDTSRLLEYPVHDAGETLESASGDFKFAAAVAELGLLLRQSAYRGVSTFASAHALAKEGVGADPYTWRAEFVDLVELAASLRGEPIPTETE